VSKYAIPFGSLTVDQVRYNMLALGWMGAEVSVMSTVTSIRQAVGAKGVNMHPDVKIVLDLLNKVSPNDGGPAKPLPWMSGRDLRAVHAIHGFQRHHFGLSTGTIEPNNITIAKLHEIVQGASPAGMPVTFGRELNLGLTAMQLALFPLVRDKIVEIATKEAERADGVKGVDAKGRHSKEAADRLKEYYTVFSAKGNLTDANYYEGTPGGVAWCGIFATWVVNQAARANNVYFNGMFVMGKSINRAGQPLANTPNGSKTGIDLTPQTAVTYSKGDICLTKEESVNEKYPTHHFLVAEDPADALREGRLLKTIEGNYPHKGTGPKHSVTFHRRAVLNYVYFDLFQTPAM
jgi:hypothetical protein